MDRDKRWERVREAYDLLVKGKGTAYTNAADAVATSYDEGVTDEFMKPHVRVDVQGRPVGRIQSGDAVIFINFRNDRAKELTTVLTQAEIEGMKPLDLFFATKTPYDHTYTAVHLL